jgi:hypothetical protein
MAALLGGRRSEAEVRGSGPASGEERRRELAASLLIGLCCLLVYNANGRAISAGDTYPARYLPFAIWQYHSVFLDPVATLTAQGRAGQAFWMVPVPSGHIISLYPVTLPVLIAPLYLPAVEYLRRQGWTDGRMDHVARIMEKLSASLVAALSAALLYRLLRRRTAAPTALLLTLAYAFGTTTWVISSQALWQHGMAELLVVGVLLLLNRPCTAPRAIAAGLLCGLLAANRPPDTILAVALGAYGLVWAGRRRAAWLAAAAALPMGLVLLYNLGVAHHFAGAYGRMGKAKFFQRDLLSGLGGLLLSPTRGLFVFSPFLLFLVPAWRHLPRSPRERGLTLAICAGAVLQLLLYAKADWRGGVSWGPRYMTDLLPLLFWMLAPGVASLRGFGRACFLLAVGAAVAIEAIGAFWYTGVTDSAIFAVAGGPQEMRAAWDWRNAPFIASLKHGLAPAELGLEMRGSLDALETDGIDGGGATSAVTAGQPVVATGWALAGHATPWQVAVSVDNRRTASSQAFFDRPDVRRALREPSPAGWRVPLGTAGLAPGEHRLAVFAWAAENGEPHYLAERDLTIRTAAGEELDRGFRTAAARLRAHQQERGYWLTSYTAAPRFQEPRQEMNTFLTSLLVDLLAPLESTGGLGDSLLHARQHLTSQIEAGGLVRYHGRPDGPGIGTLGCVITPDTDDTALVWRLAPDPDRQRLRDALATIDRYRTPEGLYRTWLSPRASYQCLDPGGDPNPADVAIQMHLLLLLAEARPPAGRALCAALRPAIDQDRVWVYYRRTPLVPILRLPDLRRAGCELELPESRMRAAAPGQEIWVSAVRLLARARTPGGPPAGAAEIQAMLRRIARDDFALVRTDPPLLYHNDLTATVSRYYWSEDAGYALWLRLFYEYAHLGHPHPSPAGG